MLPAPCPALLPLYSLTFFTDLLYGGDVQMRDRFTDEDRAKFLSFVWVRLLPPCSPHPFSLLTCGVALDCRLQGRSRLPTTVEGFAGQFFTIQKMYRGSGPDVNKSLPVAHTYARSPHPLLLCWGRVYSPLSALMGSLRCFFSVELPAYTNLDAMTSRITWAMVNTDSIGTSCLALPCPLHACSSSNLNRRAVCCNKQMVTVHTATPQSRRTWVTTKARVCSRKQHVHSSPRPLPCPRLRQLRAPPF